MPPPSGWGIVNSLRPIDGGRKPPFESSTVMEGTDLTFRGLDIGLVYIPQQRSDLPDKQYDVNGERCSNRRSVVGCMEPLLWN